MPSSLLSTFVPYWCQMALSSLHGTPYYKSNHSSIWILHLKRQVSHFLHAQDLKEHIGTKAINTQGRNPFQNFLGSCKFHTGSCPRKYNPNHVL